LDLGFASALWAFSHIETASIQQDFNPKSQI
jgi:hypothetical protein